MKRPIIRLLWMVCAFGLIVPAGLVVLQGTPLFQCLTASGFGGQVSPSQYVLDLQCQPTLSETLDIPVSNSVTVTVNLGNYYTATGRVSAEFDIHLAIDRARIFLHEADALQGTEISDLYAALNNVTINTTENTYSFVIENRGMRSAVLDLSVRPRR